MFNLRKTLQTAKSCLEKEKIDYALIGGFALGAHGIHRATKDIDLLVDGAKREILKKSLLDNGFEVQFESDEVIQFIGPGFLDILFANRPLSLEMLNSASSHSLFNVPVVTAEGIIGLKIQAYKNDPDRRFLDLADIQELLRIQNIDLEQVKKYADLFGEWSTIEGLIK